MTDEVLVRRAGAGDETAFLLLYERHHRGIHRVAWRLTGSATAAEDISHDCFMSLIRDPRRFDARRASLRTYLLAMTRNLAISHYRRRRAETDLHGLAGDEPRVASADPLARLVAGDVARHVRAAIFGLPPLQREVVVLVEYENLSLAEASAIVGADVGAVKARLHRGREALRRILRPLLAEHEGRVPRMGHE